MLYEKKKILIHRSIWFVLLLSAIVVPIIMDSLNKDLFDIEIMFLYINFCIIIAVFFICSLFLSCKIYVYNGKYILVYAGWYHHYIKVNGIKMDEHNTLATFTPIQLSCTLDDGTDIKATITLTNSISLKINNRLYFNVK